MKNYLLIVQRALPIIYSSIGLILISITDTVICARMGHNILTAQSLALYIYLTEFMCLSAFIFPIANTAMISNQKQLVLKSGIILILIFSCLVISINLIIAPFIVKFYLPQVLHKFFLSYFFIISLSLLFGAIFMYLRMITTTLPHSISLSKDMFIAFIANLLIDIIAWKLVKNQYLAIDLIAIGTGCVFLLLSIRLNRKLPININLQNIIKLKAGKQLYQHVFSTSIASSFTTLAEYLFFTALALCITKSLYEQAGFYRIIMQVEEITILLIYSITTIISVDLSCCIENRNPANSLIKNIRLLIISSTLLGIILYITYPYILSIYNLENVLNIMSRKQLIILFFSEALMLISLIPLRALAKYNLIFFIVFITNWLVIMPLVNILYLKNLSEYISLLISNNLIIGIAAYLLYKFKYYDIYKPLFNLSYT